MADDTVTHKLGNMDELDFTGWNRADWEGVFAWSLNRRAQRGGK